MQLFIHYLKRANSLSLTNTHAHIVYQLKGIVSHVLSPLDTLVRVMCH